MIKHCCNEMTSHINGEDVDITYIDKYREYGIGIIDGGTSVQCINFCPWCGSHLPKSLRDEWFDIIFDELGLDGADDPNVPIDMRSGRWWRENTRGKVT